MGMKNCVHTAYAAAAAVCIFCAVGWAYEPPERIATLIAPPPAHTEFGVDFCSVGDQNGDGFDDLLVIDDPYRPGAQRDFANLIELYYGGEEIPDTPFVFLDGGPHGPITFTAVNFLGRLTASENPYWAVGVVDYTERRNPTVQTWIFEAGDALDDEPEYIIQHPTYQGRYLGGISKGRIIYPTDLNGDGFNDLIADNKVGPVSQLCVYYGGEDFDTIPDLSLNIPSPNGIWDHTGGLDVNGDGYDDFLIRTHEDLTPDSLRNKLFYFSLYLGGDPMDTVPAFKLDETVFADYDDEGRPIRVRSFIHDSYSSAYTFLPDVNDDGYDDWIFHYRDWFGDAPYDYEGYYLYYGSEDPDTIPDLEIPGPYRPRYAYGNAVGGDINSDGIGDIVLFNGSARTVMGQMFVFFGSRWLDSTYDISLLFDGQFGEYNSGILGAVGDYDGNGILDYSIAIRYGNEENPAKIFIYSGNEDWHVDVKQDIAPQSHELVLSAHPNPFNDKLNLTYTLFHPSSVTLSLFDVQGRLVQTIYNGKQEAGDYEATVSGLNSGIYLAALVTGQGQVVRKVVCLR